MLAIAKDFTIARNYNQDISEEFGEIDLETESVMHELVHAFDLFGAPTSTKRVSAMLQELCSSSLQSMLYEHDMAEYRTLRCEREIFKRLQQEFFPEILWATAATYALVIGRQGRRHKPHYPSLNARLSQREWRTVNQTLSLIRSYA